MRGARKPGSPAEASAAAKNDRSVAFAKTTRPAMSAIVPRERLFLRLDGNRTVAWISGPPGAGKTSLAASYVEARQLRCLWYQVDADDADVATFFHYLGHAARKLEGARLQALPAFLPHQMESIDAFARRFFRELLSRAKPPFALVIDNLHSVPHDGGLHQVLEAAFSQIPKGCTVIVTSRTDPPASLARLRVTGEMICIGRDELRVDPGELSEIAVRRGHALSTDAMSQLYQRTQGWAAGLVLMLEHAKLSGSIVNLPGDATPRLLFDYLAGEIFDRFESKTQRFLLRIACLPRMTAEIARALSAEDKASRLLINLALNNYFVSEVQSGEGRSFQLHPLLRDFLRGRAAQDLPETLAPAHLRHAAELLRDAGQIEDAVALLIECRDWERIAHISAEHADSMLAQGRNETLSGWLESLPPSLLEADPKLLLAHAGSRVHASPRAARRQFELACEGFLRSENVAGAIQACCGVIDATIFEFDDLAQLDRWIDVLAGLLERQPGIDGLGTRPAVALVRGLLLRDAGNAALDAWIGRTNLPLARAMASLLRGDPDAAGAAIEHALGRSDDEAGSTALAFGLASAASHLLSGGHEEALRAGRATLARGESQGMHGYDSWLHAVCAAAALGAGDRDTARREAQRLETTGLRRGDRAVLHYLRGWLAALDADPAAAQREARTAVALGAETGLPWLECLARIALARLMADAGDRRGCDTQLRAAEALADLQRSVLLLFALRLAAADAALAARDAAAAIEPLKAAFSLGREHALRYAPWWRARATADLCVLALDKNIEPEYARSLVRAHALVPQTPPLRTAGWPWRFRVATLGGFRLLREDAEVEFSGKGPGRPTELLKVLVALGGQNVRADQLADALWPHVDADYAYKSFTATLHRLRRLLDDDDALTMRDGRLSLHTALVWTDVGALENVLAALDESQRPAHALKRGAPNSLVDEALAIYRGPFLPDESEQPGYIACREQIRARLLRCFARAARQWEEAGDPESAADCYQRLIEADPLFEAPYRNLMLCLQRGGEQREARAVYERLRTLLSMRLKLMPSPETQAVYAGLGAPAGS